MDKEWAEKLLDGEVYMRPLSAFSDILKRNNDCNNTFRRDTNEGASSSFSNGQDSNFFKNVFGGNLSYISGTGQIAEYLLQDRIIHYIVWNMMKIIQCLSRQTRK